MAEIKRGLNRDHIPLGEPRLEEKAEGTGSIEDGVSSRVEATKRRPFYREYTGEQDEPEGMFPFSFFDY